MKKLSERHYVCSQQIRDPKYDLKLLQSKTPQIDQMCQHLSCSKIPMVYSVDNIKFKRGECCPYTIKQMYDCVKLMFIDVSSPSKQETRQMILMKLIKVKAITMLISEYSDPVGVFELTSNDILLHKEPIYSFPFSLIHIPLLPICMLAWWCQASMNVYECSLDTSICVKRAFMNHEHQQAFVSGIKVGLKLGNCLFKNGFLCPVKCITSVNSNGFYD
jgi:hypothetical protein